MAITKDTKVQRIEVYPPADTSADDTANAKHETLMVVYQDIIDDPDDDDLPVTADRPKHLSKYQADGGDATDYSGELPLVQTVCSAIWS